MFVDIMTVYNAFKMPKDRLIADLSLCKEGCCPKTLSSLPCSGDHWRQGLRAQDGGPLTVFLLKKQQNISVIKTEGPGDIALGHDDGRSYDDLARTRACPFRGWGRRPSQYAYSV